MPRTMPFGKHKGEELSDLSDDYLSWLLDQELREPLRSQLEEEQKSREGRPRPQLVGARSSAAPMVYAPPALAGYIRSIVLEGYKIGRERLAGQPDKLKALQSAREHLEQLLGL